MTTTVPTTPITSGRVLTVLDLGSLDRRQLADALDLLARRLRSDGVTLTPGLRALRDLVARHDRTRLETTNRTAPDEAAHAGPVLYDYDEVADRLGVTRRTIERRVDAGELKAVAIGRARRVRPADLEAYINELAPVPTGAPPRADGVAALPSNFSSNGSAA